MVRLGVVVVVVVVVVATLPQRVQASAFTYTAVDALVNPTCVDPCVAVKC